MGAARVLHVSPSAVSQQIASLERETRTILLDRSQLGGHRAARLTKAGLALARHADALADLLDSAERDLHRLRGEVWGAVRIGGFTTSISALIAPALSRLAVSDPHLTPRVTLIEAKPGLAALRADELDLLVHEGPMERPARRVWSRDLLDDPYVVVYPVGWGAVYELASLGGRPWIDGPVGSDARQSLDELSDRYDMRLERRHQCLEYPAVLALVAAGAGAALVPSLALTLAQSVADELTVLRADLPHRRIALTARTARPDQDRTLDTAIEALLAVAATIDDRNRDPNR